MELNTTILNTIKTEPLVSIVVITYNSISYVLDTLESAKAQTYRNIELIISDDHSTDATVDFCKNWLLKNNSRFTRAELITAEKNTGIPANCNRGIQYARGKWIKTIAGDDLLLPDCISDNIDFANRNTNYKIFLSRIIVLRNGIKTKTALPPGIKIILKSKNALDQYKALLINYFGNTPSLFISKEIFEVIKYDERFKYLEDYPFALSVTKLGYSFAFLDKETVIYRIHNSSVFASISKNKIFNDFYRNKREFDQIYRFPYLSSKLKKREQFEYQRHKLLDFLNLNHRNILCRIIYRLTFSLNPYKIKE